MRKNNGSLLLKLGLVLVVLAAIAAGMFYRLQRTAAVKAVGRDRAVDAVTGTVAVDAADGGTKELKSEAAGKVIWRAAALAPGERFKEDDKLLELDSAELMRAREQFERKYRDEKQRAQLTLTGGKPELLASAAQLTDPEREELLKQINPERKLAFRNLEQAKRLRELGNVSDEEVRTLERALDTIDLNLKFKSLEEKQRDDDYKARMVELDEQLRRMTILAPADGQIHEAYAWKGMLLSQGQNVAHWFSNARNVAAKISEESFGRVKLGQPARLRLLTYGEQSFDATVAKLLPKADEAQRFTVFLDVKTDPASLLPGSTGEVTITVAERPNALMIPRVAVFDGDKVYVVKDGRVEKRTVKIGFVALNRLEVLEGLAEGEHVIIDSLDQFRDGQRVRVKVVP